MKILQTPISGEHKSAFFFDGVIATVKGFKLETLQDGEITYDDNYYVGQEIVELGIEDSIGDPDMNDHSPCVQILVDKFIVIRGDDQTLGSVEDKFIFTNYDEAIQAFKEFDK